MRDANTRNLVCDIRQTIACISQLLTLEPAHVVLTGTPSSAGFARRPPRFPRPGDTVFITFEGAGTLGNPVVAEG